MRKGRSDTGYEKGLSGYRNILLNCTNLVPKIIYAKISFLQRKIRKIIAKKLWHRYCYKFVHFSQHAFPWRQLGGIRQDHCFIKLRRHKPGKHESSKWRSIFSISGGNCLVLLLVRDREHCIHYFNINYWIYSFTA